MLSDGQSQNGKNDTLNPYDDPQVVNKYDDVYVGKVSALEDARLQALLLPLATSATVLDLGAGTGLVAKLTDPFIYAAADGSGLMLSKIIERFPSAFTVQADLQKKRGIDHLVEQVAPLAPFDLVTCIFAGHLIHTDELFRAAFDLLAPGGTLVHHGNLMRRRRRAGDLYPDCAEHETSPTYTVPFLRHRLTDSGFEQVCVVGMNAIPDRITNMLPPALALRVMTVSSKIPARLHYHVAGIARKPHD